MKIGKFVVRFFLFFLVLWLCPIYSNAAIYNFSDSYIDVIYLNRSYSDYMGCYDDGGMYKINVKEPGIYKITVTFVGVDDEDEIDVDFADSLYFNVYNGWNKIENYVDYGKTKSITVGLDKGKSYFEFENYDFDTVEDADIFYKIKVQKNEKKKVPFSTMSKLLKKNKGTATFKANKSNAYLYIYGQAATDQHDDEGYVLGLAVKPNIAVNKKGSTSYMTYYFSGKFLCYSIPKMNNSDLTTFILGNRNKKVTFDLDYSKEKNWFSYTEYFYKDECAWKCTMFNSYTVKQSNVNEVINIIKGKDAYVKLKGQSGTYYKLKLSSATKKRLLASLRTYKKLLAKYK